VRLYKFLVGDEPVTLPSNPNIQVSGIVAVVLADTEEQARKILQEDDWDWRWLEVAQVRVIELDRPRLVSYAGSFPVAKRSM
jgi:hypothetical protein